MIGHLIRYHPAFIELLAQVKGGAVGKLRHIQANRLAMGRIRNTESALFDLCPHDLSLILALTGSLPNSVTVMEPLTSRLALSMCYPQDWVLPKE